MKIITVSTLLVLMCMAAFADSDRHDGRRDSGREDDVSKEALQHILDGCVKRTKTYQDEAMCFRAEISDLLTRGEGRRGYSRSELLRMGNHELWDLALAGEVGKCTVYVVPGRSNDRAATYQLGNVNGDRQTRAMDIQQAIEMLKNYLREGKCGVRD